MTDLPYITESQPGIGGRIKSDPEHFSVEEIPLYEPSGEGNHLYIRISREGWNTKDLAIKLAGLFGLKEVDVGTAGLKDKDARAIQTFSLNLPQASEDDTAKRIEEALPVSVLSIRRHVNKLKTGHLLGNRFEIILAGPAENALDQALRTEKVLLKTNLPNFYGPQRFGREADNAERGREALMGKGPKQHWLRKLLLSAYQSRLFNEYLTRRIQDGLFERILAGDIAKKVDTGGLFEVEDEEAERPRFEAGDITFTGPIFGSKMKMAHGIPGDLENLVLESEGIALDGFRRAKLEGSRRPARIMPSNLTIEPHSEGLKFAFALPKGSYATIVMREFMKTQIEGR